MTKLITLILLVSAVALGADYPFRTNIVPSSAHTLTLGTALVPFEGAWLDTLRARTVRADTLRSRYYWGTGFLGRGYMINDSGNAIFQNLTVRGRMRVYELLINQMRSQQDLVISSTGSVERVAYMAPYYCVTTDSGAEHGFSEDDIIRAKRQNTGYGDSYDSWLLVTYVPSLSMFQATLLEGDAPRAGYEYVRMGNQSDTTRQGLIHLTSGDGAGPTITIKDGVDSIAAYESIRTTRAVLGDLTGLVDPVLGALHGYGLYSDNVYLKGDFVLANGENVGTKFSVLEGMISLIVGDSTFDAFDSTITALYARFDVTDSLVATRVSQTTYSEDLSAISSRFSSVEATADSVRLMAQRTDINGYVASFLTVLPDSIVISSDNIILDGHAVATALEADTLTSVVINGATIWGGDIVGSHFYSYPSNGLNSAGVLVNIEGGTINFMDRTWDAGFGGFWALTVTQSMTGPDIDNWNSKAAGDHNHDSAYHPLIGAGFTGQVDVGTQTLNFENGIFTGID